MTKKLLIDAHQPEETRVALLNNNRIEEFDYENSFQRQLKGNVYLARVTRVEPSLQAAFVEYGGNRQGFLAFSEIHPDYYRIPVEDREEIEAEEEAEDSDASQTTDGDEPHGDAQEASEGTGPETLGGEDEVDQPRRSHRAFAKRYKIQEVIARKQILLIQVVKEERGNKGAALTTYLSLAGRYCVLMPNANRGGGVSRKIVNSADRKRLKTIIEELDVPQGMAIIARTAGAKRTKTEIKRDYSYLAKLWDDIRTKTLESEAPSLIHEEGALVKKAVRDIYTNDIDEVIVEGEEAYKQAKAQMKMLIPSHAKKVVKYEEQPHLFQSYGIEEQLDSVYNNEVVLKSGGYLVLNQTEALVAVDVNSGKATKERNIEETALKTNLEAAEEVGRQLKLRDLSGLIVIDFIDMEENRNQHAVERRLKDAVRNDRARIQVGNISHFGLLEMSRQRLRPSLVETVSQACPHCEGTGRVRSVHSSALQMLRIIEQEASSHNERTLEITMNSEIAIYILNHKRASIADIETLYNITIVIDADRQLAALDYRINNQHKTAGQNGKGQNGNGQKAGNQKSGHKSQANQRGQKQKQNNQKSHLPDNQAPTSVEASEGEEDREEGGKKRRRGRRGGRRRKKRNQDGEMLGENGQVVTSSHDPSDQAVNQDQSQNAQTNDAGNTSQTADQSAGSDTGDAADNTSDTKPKRRRSRGRGRGQRQEAVTEQTAETVSQPESDQQTSASDEPVKDKEPATKAKAKKATKKAGKKAGKKASKKAGNSAKAKTPAAEVAPLDDGEAQTPVAKKAAKKAAKKTAKKAAKKAAKKQADDGQPADARAPISSTPADVVEVGSSDAPKTAKKGWWSR